MKKKRLIILSAVIALLVVIIVLNSTVFTLKNVYVEFRTTGMTVLSSADEEKIVSAGDFSYKKNIFFVQLDNSKLKIEKTFPYAKVSTIERKFPNTVVIHVYEREPAFYVKASNGVVILDADLKILEVVDALNYASNAAAQKVPYLSVEGISIATNSASAGDFIISENLVTWMNDIVDGIYSAYSKNQVGILSSISISKQTWLESEYWTYVLKFDDSSTMITVWGDESLDSKILKAFTVYKDAQTIPSSIVVMPDGTVKSDM